MAIKSLDSAKKNKNDEFYTRFDDISEEILGHKDYQEHFKGKVVYCNCDDPAESAFADFFKLNFEHLGLKKLICTRYAHSKLLWDLYGKDPVKREGYKLEITGRNNCKKTKINDNGDFRSKESLELLKEADIVCTNPPFSLFREYVTQLIEQKKKFLIIGPVNAITYKEFFPFIADNKVWGGYGHPKKFIMPDGGVKSLGNVQWWTNLLIDKRAEGIELVDKYIPDKYPKFDNYDAINIDNVKHIPCDYFEAMGVPISFLDKYNPEQFEIVGIAQPPMGASLRTKIYPKQIQISKNGLKSMVTKLNDGPSIEVLSPPKDKTYYTVNDKLYVKQYSRLLIRRIK